MFGRAYFLRVLYLDWHIFGFTYSGVYIQTGLFFGVPNSEGFIFGVFYSEG